MSIIASVALLLIIIGIYSQQRNVSYLSIVVGYPILCLIGYVIYNTI